MLSKEQNAMLEFQLQSRPLKDAIKETQLKPLTALNDGLIDAIAQFGASEQFARQSERLSPIDARTDYYLQRVKRHNEAGLEILSRAPMYLDVLSTEFGKGRPAGIDEEAKNQAIRSIDELKSFISDFDMKPSDTKKIEAELNDMAGSITREGHEAVVRLLKEKFAELQKLRSRPDRGAVENLAVWKVVAIIAAVGIWVAGVFHCHWFSCSVNWGMAYAIGFSVAAAIARYC